MARKPIITFVQQGDFKNSEAFFSRALRLKDSGLFDQYGVAGIEALRKATPVATGKTAESWAYRVKANRKATSIEWYNSNVVDGVNIAIILQYGHGLKQGGYVAGRDYINPAMKPLFDKMADAAWDYIVAKRKR